MLDPLPHGPRSRPLSTASPPGNTYPHSERAISPAYQFLTTKFHPQFAAPPAAAPAGGPARGAQKKCPGGDSARTPGARTGGAILVGDRTACSPGVNRSATGVRAISERAVLIDGLPPRGLIDPQTAWPSLAPRGQKEICAVEAPRRRTSRSVLECVRLAAALGRFLPPQRIHAALVSSPISRLNATTPPGTGSQARRRLTSETGLGAADLPEGERAGGALSTVEGPPGGKASAWRAATRSDS